MPAAVGAFVLGAGATAGAATVVGSVIIGAATGAIVSAVQGGNILKGAVMGGLVGFASGSIGAALDPNSGAIVGSKAATAAKGVADEVIIEGANDAAFSNVPAQTVASSVPKAAQTVGQKADGGLLSMFVNTAKDGSTTLNAGGEVVLKGLVGVAQAGLTDKTDEAAKLSRDKWEDQYIPKEEDLPSAPRVAMPTQATYLQKFNENITNLTSIAKPTVKPIQVPKVGT